MNQKKVNKQTWWIISGITILALPLLINWLILKPRRFEVVGDEQTWLIFWGSYLGAIISAVVAFIILFVQMRQNQKQNQENRQLQLKVLEYQQKTQWLTELKVQLAEYYNSFNHIDINILGDLVLSRDADKFKEAKLLMRKLSEKKNSSMFSLGVMFSVQLDSKEKDLLEKKTKFDFEFNALIEDLDWLLEVTNSYFNGTILMCGKNIQERTDAYRIEQKKNRTPEVEDNRIADIMQQYNYDIYKNYKNIVAQRMQSTKNNDPILIQKTISELIDHEQEKINNILKQ